MTVQLMLECAVYCSDERGLPAALGLLPRRRHASLRCREQVGEGLSHPFSDLQSEETTPGVCLLQEASASVAILQTAGRPRQAINSHKLLVPHSCQQTA